LWVEKDRNIVKPFDCVEVLRLGNPFGSGFVEVLIRMKRFLNIFYINITEYFLTPYNRKKKKKKKKKSVNL
jgi:hypothetical protein